MQLRRQRKKALLRAKREAAAAWESLEAGNHLLAEKQISRAVAAAEYSPPIWTDYARILVRLRRLKDAEKAARNALLLDPGFAEGHAALAEVLAGLGLSIEAYRSQERAVRSQPGIALYRELLARYEAALPADYRDLPRDRLSQGDEEL